MTKSQMMKIPKTPTGSRLSCQSWQTEAALRMLHNNIDPAVAEDPEHLVVYGGTGKAARNWACFRAIVRLLKQLRSDQTLIVQSGKPIAVFETHEMAPRVLIANSLLVPAWATWDVFRDLEARGLTMYAQMTAGSWIYIGTQGILQGTFETFAQVGRMHFKGDLRGRLIVSAGLGGMGGAQPLAATMNGAVFLGIEVDPERVRRRIQTGYCDGMTDSLEDALSRVQQAQREKRPLSVALVGNAAEVLSELVRRKNFSPDVVTDQTSAHDLLKGYIPQGFTLEEAKRLREKKPQEYIRRAGESVARHVRAMLAFQKRGAIVFEYGNNLRKQAQDYGVAKAFQIPGFVPTYIRPMFCEGRGPFRWVALSGDPRDIAVTDEALLKTFPRDRVLERWIPLARQKVKFQGLPARICWLGYGERAQFGQVLNHLVRKGKVSAPIVIGRDHLDTGSVASPYRETEGMKDGSDAIADWPILNALLNTASGATWVSVHHGGGVGIGYSIHAGLVVVADGTALAEKKLQRVLTGDPGLGVARHADAGYDSARAVARKKHIQLVGM